MRVFVFIVIGVVFASIVAGFFIVDSPTEMRLRKFDEQRVGHLQMIQGEIVNYWMKKGELPKMLNELNDNIRGFSIPTDPENREEYGYEVKDKYSFSLCANFLKASRDFYQYSQFQKPIPMNPVEFGGYISQDWQYGPGYSCFSRTIDPELYPPTKK